MVRQGDQKADMYKREILVNVGVFLSLLLCVCVCVCVCVCDGLSFEVTCQSSFPTVLTQQHFCLKIKVPTLEATC